MTLPDVSSMCHNAAVAAKAGTGTTMAAATMTTEITIHLVGEPFTTPPLSDWTGVSRFWQSSTTSSARAKLVRATAQPSE
jgi:hypothetical protein